MSTQAENSLGCTFKLGGSSPKANRVPVLPPATHNGVPEDIARRQPRRNRRQNSENSKVRVNTITLPEIKRLISHRKLNLRTVVVYTEPDAASTHVHLADEAVLLQGAPSKAYIDG